MVNLKKKNKKLSYQPRKKGNEIKASHIYYYIITTSFFVFIVVVSVTFMFIVFF